MRGALLTADRIRGDKQNVLHDIRNAGIEAGDVQGVSAAAARMQDSYRGWFPINLAAAQAKAGDRASAARTFEQALKTAEAIQDPPERAWQLEHIAVAQRKAGDLAGAAKSFERASDIVAKLPDEKQRAGGFRQLSELQEEAGDLAGAAKSFERALESARGYQDDYAKSLAVGTPYSYLHNLG